MQMNMRDTNFFFAGGTLHLDARSYVKRSADEILPKLVSKGELCYVFTARQMGKSSLMVRTIHRLKTQEVPIQTVAVDLSAVGSATVEQWYYSLAYEIVEQLNITIDVKSWWSKYDGLEYVSRFIKFLQNVILVQAKDQIAIFLDEIDSITKHDFSDDFLAVIRALYNKRATDKSFERISFVLLGAVAPYDLIKDHLRTPFNIGQRIKLDDLKFEDAGDMVQGLPQQGEAILKRIFYWTNGHPYLTQKIGQTIADRGEDTIWTDDNIDYLIEKLFLTDKALIEENNLIFIRDRILSSPRKKELLKEYRNIYKGKKTRDDQQSAVHNELKISGLVRVDDQEYLTIRNRIYRQAFNSKWIEDNWSIDWRFRIVTVVAVVSVLVAIALGYTLRQSIQPDKTMAKAIRTDQPPAIDGRLDDTSWLRAQPFTFAGHPSDNDLTKAVVRLLWDDQYLYVGFDVNDTQVESSTEAPWDGDSVSVIIRDGLLSVQVYRHSLLGEEQADRSGDVISEHHLKGATTINDPTDSDVGYSIEMKIPWTTSQVTGSTITADFLSVDHDSNPGGKSSDPDTVFSKISWDGDADDDTAGKNILLTTVLVIADFDTHQGVNNLGGGMGAAYDPNPNRKDRLIVEYMPEAGMGSVARLEYYDVKVWAGFSIKLRNLDASYYDNLAFYAKSDPDNPPKNVKVELKRNNGNEVGVVFIFKLSDSWQQYTIPLSDFIELQELDNLNELLFSFVENSGSAGVMYLDEITLTKR
jgi:hypothetical protein